MIWSIYYFFVRKIQPGFLIKKKSLVVDIGSGDKPFWRADVFVDDLSLGDVQRASESKTIHNLGIFVDANVNSLPFRDKYFDFSFCSHLLEHVDDPAKAIGEITRVSKAGYVEIPNGIIESVQPFISHLWFVYINKKKLIFVRKSKKMHEVLTQNNNKFFPVINKSKDPFIRLYWNKKIEFEVIDPLKVKDKYYSPKKLPKTSVRKNYYIQLVKILRYFFYENKSHKSIQGFSKNV